MAGRGHPQGNKPAPPPARSTRQGSRASQQEVPHGATNTAKASDGQASARLVDLNRQQPCGRWGDDGVDAYGDGRHRGSSSSGGGRGYAWQGHGGAGRGFSGPPGNFVQGVAGPPNPKRGAYRPNWAGRGGGRKPKPPLLPSTTLVATVDEPKNGFNDQEVLGRSKEPSTVAVQEHAVGVDSLKSDKVVISGKSEGGDRPTKWARKKEKMMCYRCSETGHFFSKCKAELCDFCVKPKHGTALCPLTLGPMPVVNIYAFAAKNLCSLSRRLWRRLFIRSTLLLQGRLLLQGVQ
ncbi:hypothetical protein ZWY2020_051181 [Hordeum vulgare]|nr:hypothetical protein ZWY2020_051181 [Hordeum vulgare]